MARPLIESGDITTSTGTGTTGAVSHPAYESGDLVIAFIGIDDDLTANNPSAPSTGPNGETLILSSVGSGGSSGGGPTQGVVAWLGTASRSSGTIDFTWTGSEFWAGRCVKVLAGEFDETTPLGVVSGYDGNTSDSGSTVATPGAVASWTLGSSDGGGAILVHMVVDADALTGTPSGWTITVNADHGGLSTAITQRDADSVDSETVSSVNYSTSADSSSTKGVVVRPFVGVSITDVDTDEDYDDAETGVVITGTQFEATQGTGKVEISDNAVYATGTKVEQTETAWGDTSITVTGVLGSLTPGLLWMWVTNDSAERNVTGFVVTVHRAKAFAMSLSGNIATSGENTTGQLTAPTSGTFFGGRIQDDENPADTLDAGDGQYLEDEWCIEALLASVYDETYDFRVLLGAQPAATITVTPKLTVEVAVGDITAALSIVLTTVADLDAKGELTAAAALVLTIAADLAAAGELATALSIVAAVTADLDAAGSLTAALPTVLTLAADLKARGEITTALAIALTTVADISAEGKLEAALPIIVSVVANVTDDIDLAAVLPLTVTVAAALDAAGLLSVSANIALTVAADLDAEGKLEAALAIAVIVAAGISAEGQLDAVLPIVTSVTADVVAASAQTDAYPIRRVEWTEKPPEGTPLDMSHPMAQGLFFFCAVDRAGDQIDLVHNRIGAFTEAGSSTITPLVQTPEGVVCRWETEDTQDAGFNFGNTGGSGYYEPTKLTIIARADVGDEGASGGSRIISKRDNGSASDNYAVYVATVGDFIRFRIDGSDDTVAPATGDWFNTRIVAAVSVNAAEQNSYVWDMDDIGDRRTSLGQAGADVDTTNGNLCLGFRDSGGRTFDGDIHWVAMWDGPRTAAFIEDFWHNPWQIFEPRYEPLLIESSVAVTDDITAALAIALTAAADLDAKGEVTAALQIAMSVAAALSAEGRLDAAASIALSVAADLSAQGKLEAAASLVLAVAANLKGAGELRAAAALALSVAADLNALGRLDAATAITLTIAAGLSGAGRLEAATNIVLTVAADVQAASDIDLDALLPINVTVAADVDASGSLAAAVSMVLTVAADFEAAGRLEAAMNLLVTLAGDLTGAGVVQAALGITTSVAADLDALGELRANPIILLSMGANLTDAGAAPPTAAVFVDVWRDL